MLRVHVVRYMYDERWSYTDAHDNCDDHDDNDDDNDNNTSWYGMIILCNADECRLPMQEVIYMELTYVGAGGVVQ